MYKLRQWRKILQPTAAVCSSKGKHLILCPIFPQLRMYQCFESCSVPLRQVVCMSHIPNYVIVSRNTHTYRPTVLPASLMWTLWVLLCGAPNEITSHVEGINLREESESKTINWERPSTYMCAGLYETGTGTVEAQLEYWNIYSVYIQYVKVLR